MIPAMALLIGPKEGIAIAALLLTCNNVGKVFVYRRTIPMKASVRMILLTVAGAALGTRLLIAIPESWVHLIIIVSMALSFFVDRKLNVRLRHVSSTILAFFAGTTSGLSGTSGPLKGLALRHLNFDPAHFVGAASMVSLAGDATKVAVLTGAGFLESTSWMIIICSIPVIPAAVLIGRSINRRLGERAFGALFWAVILGYAGRLTLI